MKTTRPESKSTSGLTSVSKSNAASCSIFTYRDYRQYLKGTLSAIQARNPRYSLRSLAQRLEMPVSQLSEILNGKKNLNVEKALQICRHLNLEIRETTFFCYLIALESCPSEEQRQKLLDEMDMFSQDSDRVCADLGTFEVISRWQCIALFEIVGCNPYQSIAFYADQLDIEKDEAKEALERLVELRYIQNTSRGFEKAVEEIFASSSQHHMALKLYHSAMLEKAREALYQQSPETRYTGTETLVLDASLLPEAHRILNESLDRIVKLSRRSVERSNLVHVNVNLFELTKNNREVS